MYVHTWGMTESMEHTWMYKWMSNLYETEKKYKYTINWTEQHIRCAAVDIKW